MKDKPPAINNTLPTGSHGVYVICEGQFQAGDASLYLYNPVKDSVYGDLYKAANGQSVGDVFQSMTLIGNHFFLAINTNQFVAVIDTANYKLVAQINITSPRYILPVNSTTAYVSSYNNNKIYVINTQTYSVTDSILLPSRNPEAMLLLSNSAFICSWDIAAKNVYSINTNTNSIVNTISVSGYAPAYPILDKDGMMWVVAGNQYYNRTATLTRIDPSTGNTLSAFTFPSSANPVKPAFNPSKDTLYFIEQNYNYGTTNNGIYRMGIYENNLPQQPFIAALSNQYFYALGIDPITGYIYIGDPKGFQGDGVVYIYKNDASLLHSFNVGVGPGEFYFN